MHEVSARLGYVDLRTTARYTAQCAERVDEIVEVLDRGHHAAGRAGWGRRQRLPGSRRAAAGARILSGKRDRAARLALTIQIVANQSRR